MTSEWVNLRRGDVIPCSENIGTHSYGRGAMWSLSPNLIELGCASDMDVHPINPEYSGAVACRRHRRESIWERIIAIWRHRLDTAA
jgi:hypothetical protein